MQKILIIYGSKRGKTRAMAELLEKKLKEGGHDVFLKNVYSARPEELLDYDLVLLGCSTWNDGDLEVDFIDFERKMDDYDLSGKSFAVFGPGSSRYRYFCEAVEILESRIKINGGSLLIPSLKTDELENQVFEETETWGSIILEKLKNQ